MRVPLLAAALVLASALSVPAFADVKITDAWSRATAGESTTGVVYLTATSDGADRLLDVTSPIAGKAELHQSTSENGVMQMKPVDGIDLAPGQPLKLAPRGYHIMLIGLKQKLAAGDHFPLTLHFATAGTQEVQVAVKPIGGGTGAMNGMSGMSGDHMGGMDMGH